MKNKKKEKGKKKRARAGEEMVKAKEYGVNDQPFG
jgi:hypothetical protein